MINFIEYDYNIMSQTLDKKEKTFNNLKKFLKECYITKNAKEITHSGMYNPSGKFNIKDQDLKKFYELYSEAIESGNQLSIVERHSKISSLVVDIDIDTKDSQRIYTLQYIEDIIKCYITIISSILDIEPKEEINDEGETVMGINICKAFLTEKKEPTKKKKNLYKDGFHIYFPYLLIDFKTKHLIREQVLEMIEEKKLFQKHNIPGNPSIVLDKSVIEKNGVLMYGSSKPGKSPYRQTYSFELDEGKLKKKKFDDIFKTSEQIKNRVELFSTRLVTSKKKKGLHKINTYELEQKFKAYDIYDIQDEFEKNQKKEIKKYTRNEILEARKLVRILSTERATEYHDWIKVCWCLYNIDKNILLEDFIEFSRKCPEKFNIDVCKKVWYESHKHEKERKLLFGSLHFWAEEDNPEEYQRIKFQKIYENMTLDANTCVTPYVLAKIFKDMFPNDILCYSGTKIKSASKGETWFIFRKNRWIQSAEKLIFYRRINEGLSSTINEYIAHISNDIKNTDKSNMSEETAMKAKFNEKLLLEYTKAKKSLGNPTAKNNIIKECCSLYSTYETNELLENLDEKRYIIGFNDCVFDFQTCKLRQGRPDDYVTFSTGYSFKEIYHELEMYDDPYQHPKYKQMINIIKNIQPNKKEFDYLFDIMALTLDGDIRYQVLYIFIGKGRNGKSVLMDLFKNAMGDYYVTSKTTLLTRPKLNSGAANPDIASLKGKRANFMAEPEGNDVIQTSVMKELSGGDELSYRALYQDESHFKPQCYHFLTCNILPNLSSTDYGTIRRLRVVDFKTQFVENPNPKNKREKKLIPNINPILKEIAPYFMYFLIKRYENYKLRTGGKMFEPRMPSSFNNSTMKYKKENDFVGNFVSDMIEIDEKSDKFIDAVKVYNYFKRWVTTKQIKTDIEKKRFIRDMNNGETSLDIYYDDKKQGWKCIKILEEDEDEDF